jgi:hypothetical protein
MAAPVQTVWAAEKSALFARWTSKVASALPDLQASTTVLAPTLDSMPVGLSGADSGVDGVATDVSVVETADVGCSEDAVTVPSAAANGDIKAAAGVGDVLVVRDGTTADQVIDIPVDSVALTR